MAYSAANPDRYERYLAHNEQSTMHKFKETYWNTKQVVMQKLGKKEDAHIVASDAQLDAKLEVFRAIQKQSSDLMHTIEKYQDRLCVFSQEENSMGRYLKSQSQVDRTRAGKMMAAVGKAQSFSSQQRLALRVPLVRLYQEVETFRYRAIADTLMTVNRMEAARTEYRGALLWMNDVSKELDPEAYKQMERFRKVQAQVKKKKARFDRLKLDVMQKVDLLAASRCNMFSHVLANYQSTLLHFWSKTSRTMTAVAESFKGYQYYEWNMLKELDEPSKRLAEETSGRSENGEEDEDEKLKGLVEGDASELDTAHPPRRLKQHTVRKATPYPTPQNPASTAATQRQQHPIREFSVAGSEAAAPSQPLIAFDEEATESPGATPCQTEAEARDHERRLDDVLQQLDQEMGKKSENENFMDFGEDETIEDMKRRQEEQFEFTGKFPSQPVNDKMNNEKSGDKKKMKKNEGQRDILTEQYSDDLDRDELALLNDILNAPPAGNAGFTQQWQDLFPSGAVTSPGSVPSPPADAASSFMPSQMLDLNNQIGAMNIPTGASLMGGPSPGGAPSTTGQQTPTTAGQAPTAPPMSAKSKKKQDMSAWFNLFADIDPLSNPDAIGRKEGQDNPLNM